MNPIQLSLDASRGHQIPGWILTCLCLAIILWLWSVVVIAREKTEDPFDRVVWLLIVLLLNFIGTLLYFFFSGNGESKKKAEKSEIELKRRANAGTLK